MYVMVDCGCGRRISARAEMAGKRMRCPHCMRPVDVPLNARPAAAATPPPLAAPPPLPAAGGRVTMELPNYWPAVLISGTAVVFLLGMVLGFLLGRVGNGPAAQVAAVATTAAERPAPAPVIPNHSAAPPAPQPRPQEPPRPPAPEPAPAEPPPVPVKKEDPTETLLTLLAGRTFHANQKNCASSPGKAAGAIEAVEAIFAVLKKPADVAIPEVRDLLRRYDGVLDPHVTLVLARPVEFRPILNALGDGRDGPTGEFLSNDPGGTPVVHRGTGPGAKAIFWHRYGWVSVAEVDGEIPAIRVHRDSDVEVVFTNDPPKAEPADPSGSPWKVRVVSARMVDTWANGPGTDRITVSPTQANHRIAIVDVEVEVTRGEKGRLRERLAPYQGQFRPALTEYLQGHLSKTLNAGILADLHQPAKMDPYATQLFVSTEATLEAEAGRVRPAFVEVKGYGLTVIGDKLQWLVGNFDPAKDAIAYIRGADLTAGWVMEGKKLPMQLFYSVPAGARSGRLRFHDHPPLDVTLQ